MVWGEWQSNEKSLQVRTTTKKRTVFNFTFTMEIVFRAAGNLNHRLLRPIPWLRYAMAQDIVLRAIVKICVVDGWGWEVDLGSKFLYAEFRLESLLCALSGVTMFHHRLRRLANLSVLFLLLLFYSSPWAVFAVNNFRRVEIFRSIIFPQVSFGRLVLLLPGYMYTD